jgi:hypothetical protein
MGLYFRKVKLVTGIKMSDWTEDCRIDWTNVPPVCPNCNKDMKLAYHKTIITGGEWLCKSCLKGNLGDWRWAIMEDNHE